MANIGNSLFDNSRTKAARTVTIYTPSTSTTEFTPTGGYTVGYVDVYVNKERLVIDTDFTADNGTTITLTSAVTSGDTVEVVSMSPVAYDNIIKKSGDYMVGTLTTRNVLPYANVTYDLGSSDMRFRDLYLSNSSIYMADVKLSTDGGSLRVTDASGNVVPTVSGNAVIYDSVTVTNSNGSYTNTSVITDSSIAVGNSSVKTTITPDILTVGSNTGVLRTGQVHAFGNVHIASGNVVAGDINSHHQFNGNTQITGNLQVNNFITANNVAITGNLTVNGTMTSLYSQELEIGDSKFIINADLPPTSAPVEDCGFEVNRGTSANTSLMWDEFNDRWDFTGDVYTNDTLTVENTVTAGNTTLDQLEVTGTSTLTGNVGINGILTVSNDTNIGNTTVSGFANVTGSLEVATDTVLNGLATANAGLVVIGTTNTQVTNAGNTTITGFANVIGFMQLTGEYEQTGNVLITGTTNSGNTDITGSLTVSTTTTLSGTTNTAVINATDINTSGYANIAGTIQTGDTATLHTVAAGNTTVTGFANVVGTMNVQGATTLDATTIDGITTLNANVNAAGVVAVTGNASVSDTTTLATLNTGNTTVTGFANVSSTLQVAGATTLNNTLAVGNTSVTGNVNVTADLATTGNTVVGTDLNVTGNTHTARVFSGNTDITGTITTSANATFNGTDTTVNNLVANTQDVANFVDFTAIAHPTHAEGRVFYDSEHKALAYYNDEADVTMEIGRESWLRVYNATGSTIPNGSAVYISGASGETPLVSIADASDNAKYDVVGLATHSIEDSTYGYVTRYGIVHGLDTSAFSAGTRIHLAANNPGGYTSSILSYPNHPMDIGTVIVSNSTVGSVLVDIIPHTSESEYVEGDHYVGGDLTVAGSFTVLGDQTVTAVNNLEVADQFIYLGSGDTVSNTSFSGSGLNDMLFKGHYEGTSTQTYYVRIDGTGANDTFEWSKDNFLTTEAVGVAITGAQQSLESGFSVEFGAVTGHTSGDTWIGTGVPLNLDWAVVGNYANSTNYSHTGIFRDASDNRIKFMGRYDPEITGDIDTAHASFEFADIQANRFYGAVTGAVTGATTGTHTGAVIGNVTGDVTGNTSGTHTGAVIGNVTGDVTGNTAGTHTGAVIGNASTATTLQTARTIAGQSFNGSANISIAPTDLTGVTATAAEINVLDGITATVTELNYTDGVTSNIQTQLDTKLASASYTAADVLSKLLTVDGSGSGLDADLLDGVSSGSFVRNDNGAQSVAGNLTVGSGTSSNIYMVDSDHGNRTIHCNSNQIGFLKQDNNWGAYCDDSGNWTAVGNVTAYSDIKLKANLAPIGDAIAKIKQLTGYTYDRVDLDNERQTGVVAQEVEQVLPEVVREDADGTKHVAYGNMVGLLIEAIKEQQGQIEALKAEVDALKK